MIKDIKVVYGDKSSLYYIPTGTIGFVKHGTKILECVLIGHKINDKHLNNFEDGEFNITNIWKVANIGEVEDNFVYDNEDKTSFHYILSSVDRAIKSSSFCKNTSGVRYSVYMNNNIRYEFRHNSLNVVSEMQQKYGLINFEYNNQTHSLKTLLYKNENGDVIGVYGDFDVFDDNDGMLHIFSTKLDSGEYKTSYKKSLLSQQYDVVSIKDSETTCIEKKRRITIEVSKEELDKLKEMKIVIK